MDLYLMLAIVIANALAIGIVYQFIKKLENKQKLIIIAMSIVIMYILISITYWISGFGIDESIHEATKNFITYLFVPVNMILFVPYIAYQYMKLKAKQIKQEDFIKKVMIMGLLLIIVLVMEYFYFKNVQNNINIIGDNLEQTNIKDKNELENQNVIGNEIANEIINEIINEIASEITNEVEGNIIQNEVMTNEIISNQID